MHSLLINLFTFLFWLTAYSFSLIKVHTLGAAFFGLGAGFGGAGFCGDKKKMMMKNDGLSTLGRPI